MKIALVDDEPAFLEEMSGLCRDFAAENRLLLEISIFTGAEGFLAAYREEGFSLVFLDIFMSGLSGIDTAKRLWEQDSACLLVFLTSSRDFMPDAFSCHAFDYLMKPLSRERAFRVLEDAMRVLSPAGRTIQVVSNRKTVRILPEDVLSVVTEAHYIVITLSHGRSLRCRMTMAEFLSLAREDPRFILVNKGVLVNAACVRDFEGGACLLSNGERFPVRVRDRQQIEQAVLDYHFDSLRRMQRRGKGG